MQKFSMIKLTEVHECDLATLPATYCTILEGRTPNIFSDYSVRHSAIGVKLIYRLSTLNCLQTLTNAA